MNTFMHTIFILINITLMATLKKICLLITVLSFCNILSAQDKLNIKFGKVKPEDFDVKSALIDSSTNAVVVAEVGKSNFIANSNELTFSLIFKVKKRIKILHKNGFDAATISIPLYVNNSKSESLEDLDASTYNLEGGKVIETKVARSDVFTEKYSKNIVLKKFTFPALKEGSIIEYSYEVKSDFYFNLQSWTFQGAYPVLWSQYEAAIPEFYKYVTLSQGYHPLFINKVNSSQSSFTFTEHVQRESVGYSRVGSGLNTFKIDGEIDFHTWVMKDVPALKEEPFTTTINNSISKMEFQLNQVVFPNSMPRNFLDSWEKVATGLMEDEDFGAHITRPNNWLDNDVEAIVKNSATEMEKAEKIYAYVRDNFTWNDNYGMYVSKGLKDVFKNKNGSAADINMLLIAMLRTQKIEANPIILSTRSHGFTHEFYPLLNRYNYVIAKIVIGNKEVLLDAAASQLDFGKLPAKVYNGQAREIKPNIASPVYLVADSLREAGSTTVYISNMEKGTVEGTFVHNYGLYESQQLRNKFTKSLPEETKKSLQQEYPEEIIIDNVQYDSLKLLKEPVALKYDLILKSFNDEDIVYFNPMLAEGLKSNPFKAAQRYYPVEMPYTFDDIYSFTMEIPKGYKVDEIPKSVRMNFNEDEGMFEYLVSADKQYIQMRVRLVMKRATYVNEDYQFLRDFYTYIVKKEAEQIVFKKIK
jgi:hypothetical protein